MTDVLSEIGKPPILDLTRFEADPASTLDELRPHRIVHSERGIEIIGCELGHKLLADGRLRPMSARDFSSHGASPYIAEFVDKGVFLFMEPERHKKIKSIFARGFAGKQVLGSHGAINQTANSLIDRLLEKGEADLVEDFTQRFAAESLCLVLGFPAADIPAFVDAALDLRHLVYVPIEPHITKIELALDTLRDYAVGLLKERRSNPGADFLSTLIAAADEQGRMTTDELVWGVVNLLLGGIDTTNFQLASSLQHMIANNIWDKAAEDAAIREAAIQEAMRLSPVATMLGRIVHEPFNIDGVEFSIGADVKVNFVGAGRDPQAYDDPHAYRLDRKTPPFPLIFGNGVHTCIGKNLAWMELRTGVERLTARLTDLEFSAEPRMHAWTEAFFGPYTLPVKFRARS
ncbi:MAG: cytochrome P450 [Amphiplicatus sp.]